MGYGSAWYTPIHPGVCTDLHKLAAKPSHVSIHGSVCADLSPWSTARGPLAHSMLLSWENEKRHVINPIHGAAIYGHIYHQYTPVMLALIYQHQPDPSWARLDQTCGDYVLRRV